MLDANRLMLSFGERELYSEVGFHLGDRERVCLAGRNGTGKTTLLKLITGEMVPDRGVIGKPKNLSIAFLKQQMDVPLDSSPEEYARDAFAEGRAADEEWHSLQQDLSEGRAGVEALERMEWLQHRLEHLDHTRSESRISRTLKGLGFDDESRNLPLAKLSGGWRMRAALARLLLEAPDLLLLDEPTNHLDLDTMLWLENHLRSFSGSVILISHDREFVDHTCDRLWELENQRLESYSLPFARYQAEKEAKREALLQAHARQQEEIQRLERFVERFKAKASKASQARSKQKQLDRIDRIEIERESSRPVFRFPEAESSGKWIFRAQKAGKTYEGKPVFRGADFEMGAGEKVVLTGSNGSGKTTLIKLLLGLEETSEGSILTGHNLKVGYFAQYDEPSEAEKELTLLDLLHRDDPRAEPKQVRDLLGAMMFTNQDVLKSYGVLSGGERARVRLCRLLMRRCNVLVLDEPTNHLDMQAKDLLCRALQAFKGAVIFVSHDRWFSGQLAQRVLWVRQGTVVDFPGSYTVYLDALASWQKESGGEDEDKGRATTKSAGTGSISAAGSPGAAQEGESTESQAERKERQKREKRRARDLEKVMSDIEATESQLRGLEEQLCLPDVYSDPERAREAMERKQKLEGILSGLYSKMEELEPS